METLEVNSQEDSWRLRCPFGHKVAPTNNHWYCRQCAQWGEGIDPELDVAIDAKTGKRYRRDEVKLDFEAPGVYHA